MTILQERGINFNQYGIHHLSLWTAVMLMVTVYNLTLMMMSALMSYRSSCPIYHYRVNSSVSWTFRSVWTKERDPRRALFSLAEFIPVI